MYFGKYIKSCREHIGFTQQQLVQDLYLHDIENFKSLVESTLSKWERDSITPALQKQVSILKYFQGKTGLALPCFDTYSIHETEDLICRTNMQNLLGKNKELVLNFPSEMISSDELTIYALKNSRAIDKIINIHMDMDKTFNQDYTQLRTQQIREWAEHDSNSFYVCEYNEQFFGLLFTLRLKTEIFEKMMKFEMDERELSVEDFASYNERGSNYMLSFFAMNDKAAAMLYIRYYAHIIAHQNVTDEIGANTMMDDVKKLLKDMSLKYYSNKIVNDTIELQSYRETLSDFLASEVVMKIIFSVDKLGDR